MSTSNANKGAIILGKIIKIGQTESIGSNGFQKREIVIEEERDQYAQKLKAEFVQDKCEILDKYSVGERVELHVNLRGNEYQGKYYVSLQAWQISKAGGNSDVSNSSQNSSSTASSNSQVDSNEEISDDLPF